MIYGLAIAAVYLGLAKLGFLLATINHSVSPVWPATGFAFASLFIFGTRFWPAIALGAFVANALTGESVVTALLITTGNTLEALVGAILLRKLLGSKRHFEFQSEAIAIAAASLFPTLISATIGAVTLVGMGSAPREILPQLWLTWWIGDALGGLVISPFLLSLGSYGTRLAWRFDRGLMKKILAFGAVLAAAGLVFFMPGGESFLFILFPCLLIIACVSGHFSVRFAVITLCGIAVWATIRGSGPFSEGTVNDDLVNLQLFFAAVASTSLMLSGFLRAGQLRLPSYVLLLAWVLSGSLFYSFYHAAREDERNRFESLVSDASAEVQSHMSAYEELLRGATGLYSASESVTSDEWKMFFDSLKSSDRYPGIGGMGVIWPVSRSQMSSFRAKLRSRSGDVSIRPVPGFSMRENGLHYIVKFIEPAAGNGGVLGLDLSSEPGRRSALELARDTGRPAVTSRIVLTQSKVRNPGFLLFLPMYRKGAPVRSLGNRRSSLLGWIYAPFDSRRFFGSVLGKHADELEVEVFHGDIAKRQELVFSSFSKRRRRLWLERTSTLELGQVPIALAWRPGPRFVVSGGTTAAWVGFCGALVSLLLTNLVAGLQAVGRRAKLIAEDLTRELKEAKEKAEEDRRFAERIANIAPNAIYILDCESKAVLYSNRNIFESLGYSPGDVARMGPEFIEQLTHPDDLGTAQGRFEEFRGKEDGEAVEFLTRLRDVRGQWRWMLVREAVFRRDSSGTPEQLIGTRQDVTELKRMEEALRISESQMRTTMDTAFNSLPQVVWTARPDGSPDYYNQRWFEYTGLTPERSLHEGWCPVIHPEDLSKYLEQWNQAVGTGDFHEIECRFRRSSDGEYRWHLGRALPVRGADGRILKWFGTFTDIHDQKRMEIEQQKFVSLIENSSDFIGICGLDQSVVYINHAGLQMTGLDGYLGAHVSDCFSGGEYGRIRDEVIPSILKDGRWEGETQFLNRKTGLATPTLMNAFPILDKATKLPIALATVSRDIGELKKSQSDLQRAKTQVNAILQNTQIILFALDREGICTFSDGRGLEHLGKTPGQSVGASTFELYRDHPWVIECARKALRGESAAAEGVISGRHFEIYLTPVKDALGRVDGVIGLTLDVEERKRASEEKARAQASERAALEAAELKSGFLANMSHEIRTPLNGIIGMADLLSETSLSEDQRRFAEIIQQSGVSLLALINDVLDFSKLEAGKLQLEKVSFSLSQVVEAHADVLIAKAREKELSLMTYLSPDLPEKVLGDPGRTGQILLNLTGNAIKFTQSGGVSVRVTRGGPTVASGDSVSIRFEIEDTGIGLSESTADKLFQPFVQADGSTARKHGGTGLGLSICKHLIENMGGRIGVKSVPGSGSCFWFEVPFGTSEEAPEGARVPRGCAGIRVLVMEPDQVASDVIRRYLLSWDARSESVGSLEEAASALEAGVAKGDPYSVMIIGQGPDGRGLQVGSEIAAATGSGCPALLLLTEFEQPIQVARARESGFSQVIGKPVKQALLYEALGGRTGGAWVRRDSDQALGAMEKPTAAPSSFRILVADDVAANQMLTMKLLESLGYDARVVTNGREVMESLRRAPYDLILMDCQMPEMDGFQATRLIRASEDPKIVAIPVIALTANALSGDEAKCIEAGMNGYLSKPIKRDRLKMMLERWLGADGKPKAKAA